MARKKSDARVPPGPAATALRELWDLARPRPTLRRLAELLGVKRTALEHYLYRYKGPHLPRQLAVKVAEVMRASAVPEPKVAAFLDGDRAPDPVAAELRAIRGDLTAIRGLLERVVAAMEAGRRARR